ncbi:MAG: hypothetical protein JWM55_599 [Acidimicrobiaceae bacterium]|nr:hypothetical protein [Acidimicrobiaceae bacterium]
MGIFDKTSIKLLQKSLNVYLPSTPTEIVQISSPKSLPALRVWFENDSARDYFTMGGGWHQIHAETRFQVEAFDLRISAGTGMQLISATIAADVGRWQRAILFPLAVDLITQELLREQLDESAQVLGECVGFLTALSLGTIPFTDRANQLAADLVKQLNEQIEQSRSEAEMQEGDSGSPADDHPVIVLQRAAAANLRLIDTEVEYLEDEKLWVLSFENVDGTINWFANDGGWIDDEQTLWDEDNHTSVDFTIPEMVLELAWKMLHELTDEFRHGGEPTEHEALFIEVAEWMIALRDASKTETISNRAGTYLRIAADDINLHKKFP